MIRGFLIFIGFILVSCEETPEQSESTLMSVDSINILQLKNQIEQMSTRNLYSAMSIDDVINLNPFSPEGKIKTCKNIYENTLFFRWTDQMCSLFVDQELNRIERLSKVNRQKIALIPGMKNSREYHSLTLRFDNVEICNINDHLGTKIENELSIPYYFTLDSNRIRSVYVPQYGDSANIESYIKYVLQ